MPVEFPYFCCVRLWFYDQFIRGAVPAPDNFTAPQIVSKISSRARKRVCAMRARWGGKRFRIRELNVSKIAMACLPEIRRVKNMKSIFWGTLHHTHMHTPHSTSRVLSTSVSFCLLCVFYTHTRALLTDERGFSLLNLCTHWGCSPFSILK
jgi:hypothetical protein